MDRYIKCNPFHVKRAVKVSKSTRQRETKSKKLHGANERNFAKLAFLSCNQINFSFS